MLPPFSQRTAWDLTPTPLSLAVAAHRRAGLPLIDLTETNPTRVGLGPAWSQVRELLDDSRAATYEPSPLGLLPARQAVADYHRGAVPPECIVLAASTSEAYGWLFKLLCDPGDTVLVPAPSYQLFDYLARLESVQAAPYPTRFADGWHLDLHALAGLVTPRTRAVLVVSPNNPTGAVLRQAEATALADLCARHGLALLVDEVFADTLRPLAPGQADDRVPSLAGHDGCLTFVLSGLSKVCLLPQLKLGWLAASGPGADAALARLEIIADTWLSVATPVQCALPGLLALRPQIQADLRQRLEANRSQLAAACLDTGATLLPADGGWSAVLQVPRNQGEEAWVHRLLERGVLLHPGYLFDFATEAFLVASLLVPESDMVAACAVLRAEFLAV